jgi:hypothetical protein
MCKIRRIFQITEIRIAMTDGDRIMRLCGKPACTRHKQSSAQDKTVTKPKIHMPTSLLFIKSTNRE